MPGVKRYVQTELDFIHAALKVGALRKDIASFFGIQNSSITVLINRYKLGAGPRTKPNLDKLGLKYGLLSATNREQAIQDACQKAADDPSPMEEESEGDYDDDENDGFLV
jgi:hypothetical protein